jgi:CubicO group peptidase (beta-lactamase class C family)
MMDRRTLTAGLLAMPLAARAGDLSGFLSDGIDGVCCAGLIARRGDGSIARAEVAGRRRQEPGSQAFSLDDPFRVASVSKMIATIGFVRLAAAGKVGLDDDVSALVGFRLRHPAAPEAPITFRRLLSHTSALRNGPSYPIPAGAALKAAFTPGGAFFDGGAWYAPTRQARAGYFSYADVNFCLVAQAMERLTGERFDHHMTRILFQPLGLDIGYNWGGVSQAKRDRAAPGYRWIEGAWKAQVDGVPPAAPAVAAPQPAGRPPVPETDWALGENGFLFGPQGGLRLSLSDMDRLARFFRDGGEGLAPKSALAEMARPQWRLNSAHDNGDTGEGATDAGLFRAYGLATHVPTMRAGGDAFFGETSPDWRGHLGEAYGWMTGLFWNRRDGRTLVWALNGMREEGKLKGRRSALTPQEETLIDRGLAAFQS